MLTGAPSGALAPRPAAAGQEVADRLGAFVRAARGAFSANTVRAVRADLAVWGAWCAERGLAALPAAPETVAAFVDAMAEEKAPATVRRYVASIMVAHRAVGRGRVLKGPPVSLALRRMHARKGRRQGQAQGLTGALRARLLAAAGERPIDLRNRALLAVAYDAMLRRAELTALEVADFLEETPGDATLVVRRSKTDSEGKGRLLYLAKDTAGMVRAWLDRAGIAEGRLFRSVGKGGKLGAGLDPSQVPRIFKAMAREGRPAAFGGGRRLRPLGPGRRGAGHDRRRHRAAGDPAGRALEVDGHGQPLRRAAAGPAQRRRPARPLAAARLKPAGERGEVRAVTMPDRAARPLRGTTAPNRAVCARRPPGGRIHKAVIASKIPPAASGRRCAGARRRGHAEPGKPLSIKGLVGNRKTCYGACPAPRRRAARIRIDWSAPDNESYREQKRATRSRPGPSQVLHNDVIPKDLFGKIGPVGVRHAARVLLCTAQTDARRRPGRLLVSDSSASGVPSRSRLPRRSPDRRPLHR